MINIYCLKEPVTEEVFYVGQTKLHIEVRLHQHITGSSKGRTRKCSRIRRLLTDGHKPMVHLIEQCQPEDANQRERYWIRHYSRAGSSMTNNTPACEEKVEARKSGKIAVSLGAAHDHLLRLIVQKTRRSMTEEIRSMIEEEATRTGLNIAQ